MAVYSWSQTAASNASADTTINFAEGQAPSSLNDSSRALMAAVKKHDDDITGAIVSTGTSTAYAVSSYSNFDTLAHLANQMIGFTPHTTNGTGPVTLNVDSLGAKPLRSSPNTELLAGVLVQGTPIVAVYNASDAAFYLQGFYPAPTTYNIPLGGGMDYWGLTVPNSSFAFPIGQAISRTTYATLFSLFGTTYGAGDGTTTFGLPDVTGRVRVMKEVTATRLTSTYFGGDSTALGAVGGSQNHTLTTAEMPVHNHGVTDPGHAHSSHNVIEFGAGGTQLGGTSGAGVVDLATTSVGTGISIQNAGTGNAHAIVQPSIITGYVLRII